MDFNNGCSHRSTAPVGTTTTSSSNGKRKDQLPFHAVHKVPAGDSPYVRAKHLQLVAKQPEKATEWFWMAIVSGDRVDSALKDMAVVLKQQGRAGDAIEAIQTLRHLCSDKSQDSLDNLLIDLYKKCGRVDEEIELLKRKLRSICDGEAFGGKTTRTARSHGKKFQVSVEQETARILGNLGWAYMQRGDYGAAEAVYRKAQAIEPDDNKACNLGLCLMKQGRHRDACQVLRDVAFGRRCSAADSEEGAKAARRAEEILREIEAAVAVGRGERREGHSVAEMDEWAPFRTRRLPIFEELAC